ncbi:MAG: ATP-binding cassette domain-containing protein, partial [Phycisphaeraceae bacterium]
KTTSIEFQATERKTKKLIATHNLTKSIAGKPLFAGLDLLLSPGDRLGLLGPNGSGKTTLLKCLAGELEPDAGTVKPAAELRIVRFTQHRERLDATRSLREALCPVGDAIHYRGKPIHFAAWARKFLFEPGQFNTSVGDLSGGEQARILIAQLMLEPADVLILDEPTNDLDIASLEVLEQSLDEFPGAVVLVTHDRFMLRNLATDLVALDGRGGHRFFADYEAWETWRTQPASRGHESKNETKHAGRKPAAAGGESARTPSAPTAAAAPAKPAAPAAPAAPKKLTYKLQRELDGMEDAILDAEARLESLQADAADPKVMEDGKRFAEVCRQLAQTQEETDRLYARWAELEAVQQGRESG